VADPSARVAKLSAERIWGCRVASIRQQVAQTWSSEHVQFAATGLLGNNLQAFLPDGDQVACDTLVDSVITDRDVWIEFVGWLNVPNHWIMPVDSN
jgi:hypothetical protein